MFPRTPEEFEALAAQGKTVIYAEGERPGPEWEQWGHRNGIAVWRKIAAFDEAREWQESQLEMTR